MGVGVFVPVLWVCALVYDCVCVCVFCVFMFCISVCVCVCVCDCLIWGAESSVGYLVSHWLIEMITLSARVCLQ